MVKRRDRFLASRDESKQSFLQKELWEIFSSAGLTGIGDIFFKLISYVTVWIVIRVIGPAQYGLYLLAWAVITFASIFSSAGFPAGVIKFVAQFHGVGDKDRTKGAILFPQQIASTLSLFFILILFCSAGLLETWIFKKPGFSSTLRHLSLCLPFVTATLLLLAAIQGLQIIKYRIYVEKFLQPSGFLLLVIVFFAFGFKLEGLIWAKVISVFFGFILALYFLNGIFPLWKNSLKATYENRQMITFSSPLILAVFLNFFVLYTDIMMLGYFRTTQEVGIYGVIARIVPIIILPLTSFEIIFSPMVANFYSQGKLDRLENLHKLITKWICTMSIPIFWLILLFAKPLLALFGPVFLAAQIPLIILEIGQLSRCLVGISGYIILMTGHQNLSLMNNVILFGLNTLLNYILIPLYGIYGAAVATSFSYCLINNLEMLEIFTLLKIHPYSTHFYKPLVAGCISFITALPLVWHLNIHQQELWAVLLGAPLFVGAYSILLKLLGYTQEDKFIIKKMKTLFSGTPLSQGQQD